MYKRQGDEIVDGIAALLSRFSLVVATQDWHPPSHIKMCIRDRLWAAVWASAAVIVSASVRGIASENKRRFMYRPPKG